MGKPFILLVIIASGVGCMKDASQHADNKSNNSKALLFQWQYIYASRCPYNPASLAPCYEYSSLDQSSWNRDSSYLIIDSNGNVYQNIQGTNGSPSIKDSFLVVRINDSLLHISSSKTYVGTSIKIKAIQEHLLVLEYIADPYGTSFGLDSLVK